MAGASGVDAAADPVVEAVEVRLAADEALVLLGVAAARDQGEPVGDLEVGMQEGGIRLGIHVVLVVVDVEQALERHEVVDEAILCEVVEAEDIVEPVVEHLAEQLELLRELVLLLVVGHFLDRLGRAVEVDSDLPVDLTVTGDRPEREILADIPVERQ